MAEGFNRSGRPGQNQMENRMQVSTEYDPSEQSCPMCEDPDNVDMVRCDDCRGWFHFKCVNVTRDIENKNWSCFSCRIEKLKEVPTGDDKKSTKSSRTCSSRKTTSSSATLKTKLMLERIEEERKMREAREKDYLDQKYRALEDLGRSEKDQEELNDEILHKNSSIFIDDWVERQAKTIDLTRCDQTNQIEDPKDQIKSHDAAINIIPKKVAQEGENNPAHCSIVESDKQGDPGLTRQMQSTSYDGTNLGHESKVGPVDTDLQHQGATHFPFLYDDYQSYWWDKQMTKYIDPKTSLLRIGMDSRDATNVSSNATAQSISKAIKIPSRRQTTYSVFMGRSKDVNSSIIDVQTTSSATTNQPLATSTETESTIQPALMSLPQCTNSVPAKQLPVPVVTSSNNGGTSMNKLQLISSDAGLMNQQSTIISSSIAGGDNMIPVFVNQTPVMSSLITLKQNTNSVLTNKPPITSLWNVGQQQCRNSSRTGWQNTTFTHPSMQYSNVRGQSNNGGITQQTMVTSSTVRGQLSCGVINQPPQRTSVNSLNVTSQSDVYLVNQPFASDASRQSNSGIIYQPLLNQTPLVTGDQPNSGFARGGSQPNSVSVQQPLVNPSYLGGHGQSFPNSSNPGGQQAGATFVQQPLVNPSYLGSHSQSFSNPSNPGFQQVGTTFAQQLLVNPSYVGGHGQSFPNSFSVHSQQVNSSFVPPHLIPNSLNANGQQGNLSFVPPQQPFANSAGGQPMSYLSAPQQTFINTSSAGDNYDNYGNYTLNGKTSSRLNANHLAARHAIPKSLPKFTGTPENWPMFLSAYENSTKECGYSNGENLVRLMDCLEGDALDAVRCILLHPDSVPEVIETLKMMFGRSDLVIETLMEDIQKEAPPKDNDLNSLIKFALKVRNLCATIRKFGPLDHLQNPLLVKSLVDKLPTQSRINWAYFIHTRPNVNLATFADWLYSLATVTSQVVGRSKSDSPKQDRKDDRKDNHRQQNSKSNHINAQIDNSSINKDANSEAPLQSPKQCSICGLETCRQIQDCNKFRSLTPTERWEMIRTKRLCNSCFGKHRHFKCRTRKECQVDGCQSTHHVLLHDKTKQPQSASTSQQNSKSSADTIAPNTSANNCNSLRTKRCPAIFRIIPVTIYGRKKTVQTFAYLDDGSDLTLVERELSAELGLIGIPEALSVKWAFKNSEEQTDSEIVSFRISGDFKHAPQYKIKNASTVEKLFLPTQSITKDWLESYPHLRGIQISTYENVTPRILIGLHSSNLMISQETIEGGWNEPIACRTRLGWVVQGPDNKEVSAINPDTRFSLNICGCHADNQLHQLVKEFFSFESFGTRIPEKILESKETVRARQILEMTTVIKNGRYETGLLWRNDDVHLPDNYGMALKRLNCLERKMTKDPILAKKLCEQIEDFVRKEYIRKLLPHEIKPKNPRTWYLPIFVVFNPKKPLKFRTVWDAAATVKNVSLNSVLLKGPDQLVLLPDVLRRFRERSIATTGDITEMFHQVRVREEDQSAQRFLWRDGESDRNPDVYVMQVLTFGANCSPSSAQYVKNENALKFKESFPRAVEAIVDNHYMDDMLECTHTVEEAIRLAKEVKFIHSKASFEIRNFTSNSNDVLRALGEAIKPQTKNLNLSTELTTERVLDMFWNTSTDMFTFSLKYAKIDDELMNGKRCPTKREVLRALMSIFDPLGLISNVLVYAKILLQKIWRKSTNWDEQITGPLQDDWLTWVQLLPQVEGLEIPRLYSLKLSPNCPKSIQLHIFVDASLEACATAIYYRIEDQYGVDCCLVGAKTKVAPNKPLTVPRLELQAAVLGTRLANSVGNSHRLKVSKRYFWSDSQTVLSWVTSETRKYNQFVAFRVGEILESSVEDEWNWVSTEDNIADEATKWKNKPDISSSSRWFKGPSFLYQPEEQWNQGTDKMQYTTDEELRPRYLLAHFACNTDTIINPSDFSSWQKLLRTMAYVLRFVQNLKVGKESRITGPLIRSEYIRAENRLYQQAQKDRFMDEIVVIRHNAGSSIDKRKEFDKASLLKTCSPYIDDNGVLRIKGRIDAAKDLAAQTKRPVILPRDHDITKLIIDSFHRKHHHSNHQTTLNEVNLRYFIPSLRRALKSVIQNFCQRCKNDRANPKVPEMADLPPARLATFTRPFTYAGIDYFGPFHVKVKRSKEKRWAVLVTCLTTRAIHIEVVHSLDTKSCIMAIGRFTKRRGFPTEYYSDNGSNFHSSEKELRFEFEKLDKGKMEETFTNSISQWKFNPPLASHIGGSWERMIRTVKSILYKTMPTRTPTEEMFASYLIEAEYIVNCRPLTYVHLDHLEDEILTPNHFLLGSSGGIRSPGDFNENHLLRDDWKAVQHMTNLFWRRFNVEYLPTLTRRTKWFKDVKEVKVGDLVIVVDDKNERNTWPKGIVEEVHRGKDKKVRSASIRLVRGRDNLSTIKVEDIKHQSLVRPVAKLAVLDVVGVRDTLNSSIEAVNGRENVEDCHSSTSHMDK